MRFHKLNGSQNTFGKALMLSHRRFLFHGMIFERALVETSIHVQCRKFEVRMYYLFLSKLRANKRIADFLQITLGIKSYVKDFLVSLA